MAHTEYATRPSWAPEQAKAMHDLRQGYAQMFGVWPPNFGPPPSVGDLVNQKVEGLPDGVHVKAVVADPGDGLPETLLEGPIAPAPVALFIYSTRPYEELSPPPETSVVVWLHGGGNVLGSPIDELNKPMLSRLATASSAGTIIVAPAYRTALVPDHRYPANVQDVYSAYIHLLRQGYNPKNITVAGESAGGNLALLLANILSLVGAPTPAKLIALAPTADQTNSFSEYALAQNGVDVLWPEMHYTFARTWLGEPPVQNPADPFVSAAFIPKIPDSWPSKTFVLCGAADILIDASRIVTKKLQDAGKNVEYVEVPDMPHAFWAFPIFQKQGDECWARIYEFITN